MKRTCFGQLCLQTRDPYVRIVQAQILDQHGLHERIGRVRPLRRRISDQRLGLGILGLTLGLAQAIEKDRSQVSFLGCHEGLP
jgi:hypothetical protein